MGISAKVYIHKLPKAYKNKWVQSSEQTPGNYNIAYGCSGLLQLRLCQHLFKAQAFDSIT